VPFDQRMPTLVKICGIKTEAALDAALAGGADFVGFVFYPPSPRSLAPEAAATLAERIDGRAKSVALVVDLDDSMLARIVETLRPDMLQLHGSETPERVREVRQRFGVPIMKAVKVETAAEAEAALGWDGVADRILFDAKTPKGVAGALPGGNGLSFDWHALEPVRGRLEFMLSGGLTPDNVGAAIRLTSPWAVDVSSGVESRPGEKDVALIARFLQAAREAN
jgi:phosphoribosylanthranilate isomerase